MSCSPKLALLALVTLAVPGQQARSQNGSRAPQMAAPSIAQQIDAEKEKAADFLRRSFSANGAEKTRLLALATYHKCLADRLQPGAGATTCTDPRGGNGGFPGFVPTAEQQDAANTLALVNNFFSITSASAAASREQAAQIARDHSARGLLLMREGRWVEAEKAFSAAVEIHPAAPYQAALATARIRTNRPGEALLAAISARMSDPADQRYARLQVMAIEGVAARPDARDQFVRLGELIGKKHYRASRTSSAAGVAAMFGLVGGLGYLKWQQAAVPETERPPDYDAFSAQGPAALRGVGLGHFALGVTMSALSFAHPEIPAAASMPIPGSFRKSFDDAAIRSYRKRTVKNSLVAATVIGSLFYAAGVLTEPR